MVTNASSTCSLIWVYRPALRFMVPRNSFASFIAMRSKRCGSSTTVNHPVAIRWTSTCDMFTIAFVIFSSAGASVICITNTPIPSWTQPLSKTVSITSVDTVANMNEFFISHHPPFFPIYYSVFLCI